MAAAPRNIAWYLSSHGFGHAVRSAEVVGLLADRHPAWRFFIIGALPEFLFGEATARPNVFLRRQAVDLGMIQADPRRIDFARTIEGLGGLIEDYGRAVERETAFLKRENIGGIVCDMPFLPFDAATPLGLPAAGMGNFSWDWIYACFADRDPVFSHASQLAAAAYRKCGLYLALPGGPPPAAFPRVESIPLVCRKRTIDRAALRRRLGIDEGKQAVLVAFSRLSLASGARARLAGSGESCFLLPEPLSLDLANGIPVDPAKVPFPELVHAADAIVSKPGYGIVSDAIAAGIPLIVTERDDFPETPHLLRLLETTIGLYRIGHGDFEAGNWAPALTALPDTDQPPTRRYRIDGAEMAVDRLTTFLADS